MTPLPESANRLIAEACDVELKRLWAEFASDEIMSIVKNENAPNRRIFTEIFNRGAYFAFRLGRADAFEESAESIWMWDGHRAGLKESFHSKAKQEREGRHDKAMEERV